MEMLCVFKGSGSEKSNSLCLCCVSLSVIATALSDIAENVVVSGL